MTDDIAKRAKSKIQLRLIAPLCLLLLLNSIDRVNISFGALQMNRELRLTPSGFGLGVGLFFIGYILFQAPSVSLLRRLGARVWLFSIVAFWGVCAAAMAAVQTQTQFYFVRTLLGFAEAGFAPGVVYLASVWMPRRYRATAIGTTMLAVPLSIVLGGPLCAWLMTAANPLGLAGWRWMSLAEGGATVFFAFACLALFVDSPSQAPWLAPDEKEWLLDELAYEDARGQSNLAGGSLLQLLSNPRVWLMSLVWFAITSGLYGVIFWLPQVVKQMSGGNPLRISLITGLPWLALGLGTYVNAAFSDRRQERFGPLCIALLVGGLGLGAAASVHSSAIALAGLIIGGFGLGGAQSTFWTMPTLLLGRTNASMGVALINMIGSTSGLVGPYLIGMIRERTGAFSAPIYALAAMLLIGVVIIASIRLLSRANAQVPKVASDVAAAALAHVD